jgi:hypothetical protein
MTWSITIWIYFLLNHPPIYIITYLLTYYPPTHPPTFYLPTYLLMSQPYFDKNVRMRLTLPKWELGSPPRLPKLQSLIAGVKTLWIKAFFISLESYRIVDVENGLIWTIWTFSTQVMAKRKARSQINNLTPDHQKSRIDPTPRRAGEVQHAVEKLLTRATSLL